MRRRQRVQVEAHNRERWLISYADFITLLFAFFVVMYSVSSVNEGKYKVLSETLEGVFNAPRSTTNPIPVGKDVPSDQVSPKDEIIQPIAEKPKNREGVQDRNTNELKDIADRFSAEFDALVNQGLVTVNRSDQWVELTLRNSLLFTSGSAEPHYDAFPVVEKIAKVVRDIDKAIMVEGFTDNRPINSNRFPSNWELSAARAAAVVRLLNAEGVDPQRMAAVGYGEFQPVARNDTAEGRRRNRRVVLMVSRQSNIRGALR
ncbi:flagellar motor protein MotD [Marinobacteraceae bacterium S3BR75-40.1]